MPTEEQIKNHTENYKKAREEEWRNGVQMYINKAIAAKQQEMSNRGLKYYTWRWMYESHKVGMKVFRELGFPYRVDWEGELKNWGIKSFILNYSSYLLAKIT